jgi:hypothetical protein
LLLIFTAYRDNAGGILLEETAEVGAEDHAAVIGIAVVLGEVISSARIGEQRRLLGTAIEAAISIDLIILKLVNILNDNTTKNKKSQSQSNLDITQVIAIKGS